MTEPTLSTRDELHRRVGRNLLMFQRIEQGLRFVLPYIHPEASARGLETMRAYRDSISDAPLGALIEDFKACVRGVPEGWDIELDKVRKARNELVHGFFRNESFYLPSAEGASQALIYLDQQHKNAEEWAEIFRVQSLLLLLALIDSNPTEAAKLDIQRDQLVALLPASLEIVDAGAPDRTHWPSTRIVHWLRLAEQHTKPDDGMALLSRAGRFIKEHAPDITAKAYGLATLKQILLVSQLFEVRSGDAGGPVWYRSTPELARLPLAASTQIGLSFSVALQT